MPGRTSVSSDTSADACKRFPPRKGQGRRWRRQSLEAGQTRRKSDRLCLRLSDLRPRRGLIARDLPEPSCLLSSCPPVQPYGASVVASLPERPRISDVRRTKMIFVILVAFVLRDGLFLNDAGCRYSGQRIDQ